MIDSLTIFNQQAVAAGKIAGKTKFFLLEDMWQWLTNLGIGDKVADLFCFITAAIALAGIVLFVDLVIIKGSINLINKASKKTATKIDNILLEQKFFSRLFQLIPLLLLWALSGVLFAGFEEWIILFVRVIVLSVIVLAALLVVFSLLNTWNIVYQRRPGASEKSIKGYLQLAKIVLSFIAGILILSVMMQKNPSSLFVGLGATAALFSLVFRDTILGFVASIQLSAQDMVHPGDWITMPAKNADGVVLDINVNSVKVQNWDNTITMIPIYSMVNESFTNWRGMLQSEGRRFVRQFFIDLDSVKFVDKELMERLRNNDVVAMTFDQVLTLAKKSSKEMTLTNLGLFRSHLDIFMREHPKVSDELPMLVRYGEQITEKGVMLEIYAFSLDKESVTFDAVHRSVVEYVIACAPVFGLKLYMAPSGSDVRALTNS